MSVLTQLKAAFENDTVGYISVQTLSKISHSRQLISQIAYQYGYRPHYTGKHSHRVQYYVHYNLPKERHP